MVLRVFFFIYYGIIPPYYRVFFRLFGPLISVILFFFSLENENCKIFSWSGVSIIGFLLSFSLFIFHFFRFSFFVFQFLVFVFVICFQFFVFWIRFLLFVFRFSLFVFIFFCIVVLRQASSARRPSFIYTGILDLFAVRRTERSERGVLAIPVYIILYF